MSGVSITTRSNSAAADSVTTVFNFTFFVYSAADIKVYSVLDDVLTPITTGITKAINSSFIGGSVTFSVAPLTAVGDILIRREVPYTQTTEFADITRYKETAIESALNTIVLQTQQIAEESELSPKYTETSGVTDATIEEPVADCVLKFSGTTGRIVAGATSTQIEQAATNAAAAASSAAAAAASAAAAATFDPAIYGRFNDFHLSLTSGTPVTTADVTGATTIYAVPYGGNRISLYVSGAWVTYNATQFQVALGTLTNDIGYDVFCYSNNGVPTLELLAWTNSTTRATSLNYQDGVPIKNGDATRRYLGSFLTTSTTTTEDSAAKRYLWNYYHRTARLLQKFASGSWTYTTNTLRQANNSTDNQLNFFIGVIEDTVFAKLNERCYNTNTGVVMQTALGLNSTTTAAPGSDASTTTSIANGYINMNTEVEVLPALGKNYVAWLEASSATGTSTWEGFGTFGLQGRVWG